MKLENCPKCSKELIVLQSSGRHICPTCGAFEQEKNEETEQLKDSEVISSKASETLYSVLGLTVLVFIFGGCVASMISPEPASNSNSSPEAEYNSSSKIDPDDPEYIKSVIDRSGVGQTIDSVQEVVDACMVMQQDNGMSSSQAYDYCN